MATRIGCFSERMKETIFFSACCRDTGPFRRYTYAIRFRRGNDDTAPRTILVVEDEVLIRFAIADYLRDCGYRVLEAGNGAEAQELVTRGGEPIHLVFSDIQMPGTIDGFALARWLRANNPAVKIILTSGVVRSTEVANDLCELQPIEGKPYNERTLLRRIQTMLQE
jgi:CheY-like chemotaxis protein